MVGCLKQPRLGFRWELRVLSWARTERADWVPLAYIDVQAADVERLGEGGVSCDDRHVMALKGQGEIRQGPRIDHAQPVGLAGVHSQVVVAAP